MKKILILLVIIMVCLMSSCCISDESGESGTTIPSTSSTTILQVDGFPINNAPVTHTGIAYSIEELNDYFSSSSASALCLEEINATFPIQYLRKVTTKKADYTIEHYYIAYPVLNGGTFIVYLDLTINFETGEQWRTPGDFMYIHNLPDESILSKIESSKTYDDVKAIAPCTILNRMRSSSIISYSLLQDGKVLICSYTLGENETLVLSSATIASHEDSQNPFSGMVYSDLLQ